MKALPDPEHRQRRMKFHPRYGTAVTDGQFMTSRDGRTFRRWDEAFLRPGPERRDNWLYGDGSVHSISKGIDMNVFMALSTISGGEVLPDF